MNKVVRYKAKDMTKGMSAEEIRKALDDAERSGTIITIKALNGFNGKIHALNIESVLGSDGVQA